MGTSTLLRYCEKRRIRHTVLWGERRENKHKTMTGDDERLHSRTSYSGASILGLCALT